MTYYKKLSEEKEINQSLIMLKVVRGLTLRAGVSRLTRQILNGWKLSQWLPVKRVRINIEVYVFTGNNWLSDMLQTGYVKEWADHSLQNSDLRSQSERQKHREEKKTPKDDSAKIQLNLIRLATWLNCTTRCLHTLKPCLPNLL